MGVASRCLALPAWRGPPHRHTATRRVALTSPRRLAAAPPPEGWLVLYPAPLRCISFYTRECIRVTLHSCHAPSGARQGPRRLGCASSPPLRLGRRPSRAGRHASGAVRAWRGPLSTGPAVRHAAPSPRRRRARHALPPPRVAIRRLAPHCLGSHAERASRTILLASGALHVRCSFVSFMPAQHTPDELAAALADPRERKRYFDRLRQRKRRMPRSTRKRCERRAFSEQNAGLLSR